MADKDWHRSLDDPIPARRRTAHPARCRTLLTKLPKREHDALAWRAAIQALMLQEAELRS
jgi:hypothetical protein